MKNFSSQKNKGFSTIELMIAFAIMSIALVGAVTINFAAQYWTLTSRTSNEALYKAKTKLEDMRSLIKQDFYNVVSTPFTASVDAADPADQSCIDGGLCYLVESNISDISSCSKYVEAKVEWRVNRYPTTTTSLFTNLTNTQEIISRGGDCILNTPSGNWQTNSPQLVGEVVSNPGKQYTGVDTLHRRIYTTSRNAPSFSIYSVPTSVGTNPTLLGSLDVTVYGTSIGLNSVDAYEDLSTGRTYVYATVHASSTQLVVIDTTNPAMPEIISRRTLNNVVRSGSYPEGFRNFVYGGRLYITVRETSGTEFHIFDISTPTLPTEIGNGFELNRTVEEIIIRDQKIGNVTKRLAFLATDSNTRELTILDVTDDTVSELATLDLAGDQDGYSLSLTGKKLYFGRANNTSGPELYVFDVTDPAGGIPTLGQAEVGSDVLKIEVSGDYAFLGTRRSGDEFQIWNSDYSAWTLTLNSGRYQRYAFTNFSPLGFDIDRNWIYLISSNSGTDRLQIIHRP